MYDGYKGTRHAMPDELAQQMPILKELLTDLEMCIRDSLYTFRPSTMMAHPYDSAFVKQIQVLDEMCAFSPCRAGTLLSLIHILLDFSCNAYSLF